MNTSRVREVVRRWRLMSEGETVVKDDPFFRFMTIWVAFNALYSLNYGWKRYRDNSSYGDKEQVKEFTREERNKKLHRNLLQNDSEYFGAVIRLQQLKVTNETNNEIVHIRDTQSLFQVAMCVYTVRCNLFHGGKMPEDERDEEIVESAYQVVRKWVN